MCCNNYLAPFFWVYNVSMEKELEHEIDSSHKIWFGLKISKKIIRIAIILIISGFLINIVFLALSFKRGYFRRSLNAHAGKISEISETSFIVEENGGKKIVVTINPNTDIRKGEKLVKDKDVKIGNYVFIVGPFVEKKDVDNSEKIVDAKVIRVFDDIKQTRMFDLPKY